MGFLRGLFGAGSADDAPGTADATDDGAAGSPGWDAIDAALAPIYGDQEPSHWGTLIGWRLGGPDPLDGVSAYRNPGPPTHWHFVTYGLSELYTKESDDPESSGWGFEMTFRLRREETDTEAPIWAVSFLQNLARYVFETGNVFGAGHSIDAYGPIAADTETQLVAAAFAADPDLGPIDTPHGRLEFVQVVGLTRDEYEAVKAWDTRGFLGLIGRENPLLVTDLDRGSLLAEPDIAADVAARTAAEGSSTGAFYVDDVLWSTEDGVLLSFGASGVPDIRALLSGRIAHGKGGIVEGEDAAVEFLAGPTLGWTSDETTLHLTLPADAATGLAAELRPVAGDYPVPGLGGLRVRIVRSVVRDSDGNEIGTIG